MEIRYDEWLPGSGVSGIVSSYWSVIGDAPSIPYSAILPDGHLELVFNLGHPVALAGPTYTGMQPDRAVVGPMAKAIRLKYGGRINTFGIRFHPARGAGFLGHRATALANRLTPLLEVCPHLDKALSLLFLKIRGLETEAARIKLDDVLREQLPFALPADVAVETSVERLRALGTAPLISQLAREVGLSPRQLQRRFLAAVGLPPKQFVRVVRFAQVWRLASMGPQDSWAELAVAHGYADQAHMVREFRAFGAEPPTHVFTQDWYNAAEMLRSAEPGDVVRSIQDEDRKARASCSFDSAQSLPATRRRP